MSVDSLRDRWDNIPELVNIKLHLATLNNEFISKFEPERSNLANSLYRGLSRPIWKHDKYPFNIVQNYWNPIELIENISRVEYCGNQYYDFRGIDLGRPANFYGARLDKIDFSFSTGRTSRLISLSYCSECLFNNVDYHSGNFSYAFVNCRFIKAKLFANYWSASVIKGCLFESCKLTKCHLSLSDISDCNFINCDFRQASLARSRLTNIMFQSCSFRQGLFDEDASLYKNCQFIDCDFRNTAMGILPPQEMIKQS